MSESRETSIGEIIHQIGTLEPNTARLFYERLKEAVTLAEGSKAPGQELVIYAQGVSGETLTVEDLGYRNPSLIYIVGQDPDGIQTFVFSHPSSVQLVAKWIQPNDGTPKRKIGFIGSIED